MPTTIVQVSDGYTVKFRNKKVLFSVRKRSTLFIFKGTIVILNDTLYSTNEELESELNLLSCLSFFLSSLGEDVGSSGQQYMPHIWFTSSETSKHDDEFELNIIIFWSNMFWLCT